MYKKVKKWIKKRDLVGYQVNLSYNGNGNVHQTLLGGTISSLVLALMLYITYGKSYAMVTNGNDDVTKVTQLRTEEDIATSYSLVD